MHENTYIKALESTGSLSEPAIRSAIKTLAPFPGSKILDVPCGTGSHAQWILEMFPKVQVTGLDLAEEHVKYAQKKLAKEGHALSSKLCTGDINKLEFDDNTFDFVWCCDGLWPGPKEMGCVAEEPYQILKNMIRVTKAGGKIAILFWSEQKLLPGYPLLEARLNATQAANVLVKPGSNPELHFMCTRAWLKKVGLTNIKTKTFAADIIPPFNDLQKEGILSLFEMFWGRAESEVSKDDWTKFKSLTNPDSNEFILKGDTYTGILTYTMFCGEVEK